MAVINSVGNALTGSTGSGAFVGANTPTLTTPLLGTPTSGNLANCTGYPGSAISGQVPLANGGTSANLTASNGGIFYSTGSAGAILSGTATARQMLQSGASTTPAWSTTTWPATSTVNRILYSSSANVIGEITTGNNGVLITSAGGVPSISSTLPSGIAATNMSLTTPSLGAATATSVNFGGSSLSVYSQMQSWTPTFTFVNPGDVSVSYATRVGYYSRIGNIVVLQFYLTCTPTYTTATGIINITGLPFTSNSSSSNQAIGSVYFSPVTYPAGTSFLLSTVPANSAYIAFTALGTGTAVGNLTNTSTTSGVAVTIIGSISYLV